MAGARGGLKGNWRRRERSRSTLLQAFAGIGTTSLASNVLILVSTLLAARLLGASNLGAAAIVIAVQNLFLLGGSLGIPQVVSRVAGTLPAEGQLGKARGTMSLLLIANATAALVFLVLMAGSEVGAPSNYRLDILLPAAGWIVAYALAQNALTIVRSSGRLRVANLAAIIPPLVLVPAYFVFLPAFGLPGMFLALFLLQGLLPLLFLVITNRDLCWPKRGDGLAIDLVREAWPLLLAGLAVLGGGYLLRLAIFHAGGTVSVGAFQALTFIQSLFVFGASTVVLVLLPALASRYHAATTRFRHELMDSTMAIACLIFATLAVVSPLGAAYLQKALGASFSITPLLVYQMAVTGAIMAAASVAASEYVLHRETKLALWVNGSWLASLLVLLGWTTVLNHSSFETVMHVYVASYAGFAGLVLWLYYGRQLSGAILVKAVLIGAALALPYVRGFSAWTILVALALVQIALLRFRHFRRLLQLGKEDFVILPRDST